MPVIENTESRALSAFLASSPWEISVFELSGHVQFDNGIAGITLYPKTFHGASAAWLPRRLDACLYEFAWWDYRDYAPQMILCRNDAVSFWACFREENNRSCNRSCWRCTQVYTGCWKTLTFAPVRRRWQTFLHTSSKEIQVRQSVRHCDHKVMLFQN